QPFWPGTIGLLVHDVLADLYNVVERSQGRVVIEASKVRVSDRVDVFRQVSSVRELVGELVDQALLDGPGLLVNGQALFRLSDSGVYDADLDETAGEPRSVSRVRGMALGQSLENRSRLAERVHGLGVVAECRLDFADG